MGDIIAGLSSRAPSRNTSFTIAATFLTTIAISTIVRKALNPIPKKVMPGPTATLLPRLSKEEQEELPYPPDVFPGARDVASPYGTIRVYEWGPENGRKILLIHGISTPCISLGAISTILVERGCRVILMDLFGRGYSDSPDLPHDERLYATQILLAITSSPLPWTPNGFSIIGYSLGGGIAVDFAAYFPNLVKGLAILAPSGLVRPYHFGWHSKLVYNNLIPLPLLQYKVRKRLTGGPRQDTSSPNDKLQKDKVTSKFSAENAAAAETKGSDDQHFNSTPLSKNKPHLTVASAVEWQLKYNEGFIRSFVNSIRHSSISGRSETWAKLRGLTIPILIFAGKVDPVIVPEELEEDAKAAIGAEKVHWRLIEGGHEFPITQAERVVEEIAEIWAI